MLCERDPFFIDIETTFTSNEAVVQRIASKVKHPGSMSKQDTIDKWTAEKKPEAVREAVSRTALNGGYGQIIAIGTAVEPTGGVNVSVGDERQLLVELMETPVDYEAMPLLVGHNIVNFDIPFIRQRCIVHGVKVAYWFPKNPKPWGEQVCDTMIEWAGPRELISLSELAFILGIEVPETIPGAEVPQAFVDGRLSDIVAHCTADIAVVRAIYAKLRAAQ